MSLDTPNDSQLPVAVLSDAHLGGRGGDGRDLVGQLDALSSSNCRFLLLIGDLFQVWLADPRCETSEIKRLLPALEGVRERGVPTVYIEGNRDFFLRGSRYARMFDKVALEHDFELGGVRYLVVHGDGLNDRDWRYRFWRRLSKNAVCGALVSVLPGRLVRWMLYAGESALSRTNFRHKLELPVEVIRRYGERRLGEGHDVVLLGHFHRAVSWQVIGGEVRIFDAWYNDRRLVWLGDP